MRECPGLQLSQSALNSDPALLPVMVSIPPKGQDSQLWGLQIRVREGLCLVSSHLVCICAELTGTPNSCQASLYILD